MTSRAAASAPQQPGARFGARAGLAALALVLVAVPFGLLLFLVEDKWPPLLDVDDDARDSLHGFAVAHAGFVTAMRTLSTIGSAFVYVPLFALVAVWLLWRGRPRLAIFVVVTMAGSVALNALVKLAVHRARPVLPDPVAHANGLSFPSGHAQSATVAACVLALLALPHLGRAGRVAVVAAAVVWVAVIGFARVSLGVHFVSDVLAGAVLGAAWVAATTAAFRAWQREERGAGVSAGGGRSAGGCSRRPGAPSPAPPGPRRP
jgi:membrane-associated phospholipid phosphatase